MCKHENTSTKFDTDGIPEPYEMEFLECLDCGAWLSIGPANDDSEAVQVEIRAARLATLPTSTLFKWQFGDAGYLASCIATHDEEQS